MWNHKNWVICPSMRPDTITHTLHCPTVIELSLWSHGLTFFSWHLVSQCLCIMNASTQAAFNNTHLIPIHFISPSSACWVFVAPYWLILYMRADHRPAIKKKSCCDYQVCFDRYNQTKAERKKQMKRQKQIGNKKKKRETDEVNKIHLNTQTTTST